MENKYYLLALTANDCPGCISFKEKILQNLLLAIKKFPNIEYLNYNSNSLGNFTKEINLIDKRILSLIFKQGVNTVPNISLVPKKQLDDISMINPNIITYKENLSKIDSILDWIKNTTNPKTSPNPPPKNEIVLVKNGIEIEKSEKYHKHNSLNSLNEEKIVINFDFDDYSDSDEEIILRI